MTNKEYKKRKAERQAQNRKMEEAKQTRMNFTRLISIIVVVALVAVVGGLFGTGVIHVSLGGSSFSPPSSTPFGGYEQISASSYATGNNVTIYYFSWYGCPYGATDSWSFYEAVSQYLGVNISSYVSPHYSYSNDVDPNTPGLIFTSFHIKNLYFDPIYVYNQTMTGTVNNVSIAQSDLVQEGLSEINSSVPSAISALEYKYLAVIPISGSNVPSFYGFSLHHVNTNIIVAGAKGAWLFNGPIYSPSILSGLSPQYVLNDLSNINIGGVSAVLHAINSVA